MRLLLASASLVLLAALPARAEGFLLRLEPGYVQWRLDGARIQAQPGVPEGEVQPLMVEQVQDAPSLSLVLGYNIRDHVTLSLGLTGTGWDLLATARGGAGLAAFEVAWHPVALLSPQRLGERRWDAALFGAVGYGVVGEQRALDGLHYQVGARAEYLLAPWFSLGAAVRHVPLRFGRYVVHWNNGEAVALPRTSGGSALVPALTVTFHTLPGD